MEKHNADDTKVLDSSAVIYKNKFGVWQFRYWLKNENKYIRRSLKTKVKDYAMKEAKELYFKIQVDQKEGKKQFAISVKEAVEEYLIHQKKRVGDSDFHIVEGRYKTIETTMKHFLNYVRKDDRITDLDENTLQHYERNGEITTYVLFRSSKGVKEITILNEMSQINHFMKHCYTMTKVTHIPAFHYPQISKKSYNVDGELVRRQTFTSNEYKAFTQAMITYTAKKHTQHLTKDEIFERHLNRSYFLFAANSGLRSGEIRQLKWKNITTYKSKTAHGSEGVFAKVLVEKGTSKVRKSRWVHCRGGEYIERWKVICKENGRDFTGNVFSLNGNEYLRYNTHRQFKKIMSLAQIDEERKAQLVPYSLRHFMITERVKAGLSFSKIAVMCATSVRQIENTYLHLNEEMMKSSAKADYITLEDGTIRPI